MSLRDPRPSMLEFRAYQSSDRAACEALFDKNCPEYFAPNERPDFLQFLEGGPSGYEIVRLDGHVVAAFGLAAIRPGAGRLSWILVDPNTQGQGVGSAMMGRVEERARASALDTVHIAASHLSAPFFSRFHAKTVSVTEDGWGRGMHRHDMVLEL